MKMFLESIVLFAIALFWTAIGLVFVTGVYSCIVGLFLYLCNGLIGTSFPIFNYAIAGGAFVTLVRIVIGKKDVVVKVR